VKLNGGWLLGGSSCAESEILHQNGHAFNDYCAKLTQLRRTIVTYSFSRGCRLFTVVSGGNLARFSQPN